MQLPQRMSKKSLSNSPITAHLHTGPWGIPILGYAPFIHGDYELKTLTAMRKKHGDILTMSIFQKEVVVLSDWELVRDFFGRLEVSGRPDLPLLRPDSGELGLAFSQGRSWQENRRLTVRIFKNFGFGNEEALDSIIQDSVLNLCQFLKENQHKSQELGPHLNIAVLNIIWKIIAGRQFPQGDATMQGIVNKYNQVLADSRVLDGFHPAPNLVYLWPPALRAFKATRQCRAS
ncbi:unnamed protein product, partial [Darwinula stevensoni]